jgi:hypothetical protein
MIDVYIDEVEIYPAYRLHKYKYACGTYPKVLVSEDLFERYKKVMTEYEQLQNILEELCEVTYEN